MDEIILNETQKLSAARVALYFLESDWDENDLYPVDKWVLKRLNRNLNDLSVCFNAKRKIHMRLKSEIIWYIYMTKK